MISGARVRERESLCWCDALRGCTLIHLCLARGIQERRRCRRLITCRRRRVAGSFAHASVGVTVDDALQRRRGVPAHVIIDAGADTIGSGCAVAVAWAGVCERVGRGGHVG